MPELVKWKMQNGKLGLYVNPRRLGCIIPLGVLTQRKFLKNFTKNSKLERARERVAERLL
jgi:hypothetical protein